MTDANLDQDAAWAAFVARDRAADGRFVVAVRTTRIYCKPSCPARRPRRENIAFLRDAAAARAAGYRACLRCLPDAVARDDAAVARAVALLAGGAPVSLAALAAAVGYAPHHFHRLFRRATGVTPAAWARGLRARRVADALARDATVADAIYDAGYAAPSRFYADAARLGMTPVACLRGGAGTTIHWTVAATSLGALLVAATDRGPCRIALDEDERALHARFPAAAIHPGGTALADGVARAVVLAESSARDRGLPRAVRAAAFEEAVRAAMVSHI